MAGGEELSLQLLIATMQNAVIAVNGLNQTLANTFPQQGTTATTATAGAATLPAAPVKFLNISVQGTTFKVPLYNT